ncbi:alpha/beta hydrolase [Pannonibacter tanglangensis]|uniref:Alpha/beta hydrolase fold domain-containing protein n=1 Tax=Pannonibacter tanglangensis TaxID=2750084 RepID=A0ABW9ZIK7_9HYPH|nr:alpha/beta hydrolase [Pannonibacter sp. XCT-34]NBN62565.1 alpha/beta hydrolase fold domain-containing protein [Pannonibacter sp. XCT-34]
MSDVPASAASLIAEGAWPRDRLDVDYTARNCVAPERFTEIIAAYLARSAPARAMGGARLDLVYDARSGEKLDLYGTRAGELRPLVLFIHGGYWRALSKDHSAFMAPMLADLGIASAAPDYSLAPGASLTEITRQMRSALAYLWREADSLGIDRRRIVVTGSSAGGHLAGTLMMTGWQQEFGLPGQVLKGALPLSGLFELAPVAGSHVQDWMQLTPAEIESLSPLRRTAGAPQAVIAVAEHETAGFHRQTRAYAEALGRPELLVRNRNHFDIVFDLCDPATDVGRALLALVSA